jgi:hypothetical protein
MNIMGTQYHTLLLTMIVKTIREKPASLFLLRPNCHPIFFHYMYLLEYGGSLCESFFSETTETPIENLNVLHISLSHYNKVDANNSIASGSQLQILEN